MKSLGNVFLVLTTVIWGIGGASPGKGKAPRVIELVPPMRRDTVGCPKVQYYNQSMGYLFSPNYPSNYPNSDDCIYQISGPIGTRVTIIFEVFELEVCCDFVTLYDGVSKDDGSNLIAKISGSHSAGLKFTTNESNILEIHFSSDPNFNEQGFYASFDCTENSDFEVYNCDPVQYTANFGVIVSPQFPNNYPPNSDCSYTVGTGKGTVVVTVESFSTEPCCDHLRLYDGTNSSSPMIMEMSGTQVAGTQYTATSGYLYAEFLSDPNTQYPGYSLQYVIVPQTEDSLTTPKSNTVMPIVLHPYGN